MTTPLFGSNLLVLICVLLVGCGQFGKHRTATASLRDVSLEQAYRGSSVPRVNEPSPALFSKLVFDPQNDDDFVSITRTHRTWCAAHGGSIAARATSTDCFDDPLQKAGCVEGAEAWYQGSLRDSDLGMDGDICVDANRRVLSAVLRQGHQGRQDDVMVVFDGPTLQTFVQTYQNLGRQTQLGWEAAKNAEAARKERALDQELAKLDSNADPALRSVATARMSLDFIREKLRDSAYDSRGSFESACTIEVHGGDINPSTVELSKIDLNVLAGVAERTIERHGKVYNTYRVFLKVGAASTHLDYSSADAAQRTSKAFDALAKRCGNKPDTRFK